MNDQEAASQTSGDGIPNPIVRHQQLIVTLFGLYCRNPGNSLPVASLVSLLGDLGYDAPGVRSAVSRLKAKGVLRSTRVEGIAAYKLSESQQTVFAEGDQRIFAEQREDGDHDWLLALFSVPEAQRHLRHRLRTILAALGFGTVTPGVWIASSGIVDRARASLAAHELDQFVEFFRGDYLFDGDVRAKVATWWNLEAIDELIGEFLEVYSGADTAWAQRLGGDPEVRESTADEEACRDAFRYYVPMLTLWRRLPYRDPNLPLDYLPEWWREPEARRVFGRTYQIIAPLAERHASDVIDRYRS
ncbi:PaaX family transcriptional regulator C-terminal domain-containing protein [Arthrobacter roseus]|uniref:PaaX family transcriptional regulator n=1 Tax=Arthrobacter roseus TaxID=136274 RepID=UPI001963F156|nr:PaaX family transcriptional regulator C-terminal domain-containing protein [Arthrobacter roseus]MBM7847872.1 phenylacetic acid degradation operon negative regulatory protein [Arthrobacter roseus]